MSEANRLNNEQNMYIHFTRCKRKKSTVEKTEWQNNLEMWGGNNRL